VIFVPFVVETISGGCVTKAPLTVCLAVALVGVGVSAQTPRLTFEVASIKKIDKPPVLKGFPPPAIRGGTVTLLSTNVPSLIQMAYGLRDFQVVGGPDWVRSDLFEVQAKAAGEPTRADVLLMLQSLLEDRFGLRLRKEEREIRFLAMVLARDDRRPGPALRSDAEPDCGLRSNEALEEMKRREASGHAMGGPGCGPLARVAEWASRFVEMPVLDRTGLTGNWGGMLYFAADPNVGPFAGRVREPDPGLPTFTTALRDQFGLRLESTRGPVEVHVIEAVRQPTEN
jgi:uncharacterized protein (TIGR03435 family)